jgi:hypothetical protein
VCQGSKRSSSLEEGAFSAVRDEAALLEEVEAGREAVRLDAASAVTAGVEAEDGVGENAERLEPQPLRPITRAVMAAVNTFCDRKKQGLDTTRYVGIVRSPNARGVVTLVQ